MEAPIVICNTTPVINFAEIGRMDVLERLFGRLNKREQSEQN